MALRGGSLQHSVNLQSRSSTQDAIGGQSSVWTTYYTAYAAIRPLTGRELLIAQSIQSEVSHEVTMYVVPWFTPKPADRIVFCSRIFDIKAVMNEDELNRQWTLLCVEGLTQG